MRALGFDPKDIRWTILTHLHLDHDGGLEHVLDSEIIVAAGEYQLAKGLAGRLRGYLPHRWPDGFDPRLVTLPERPYGPFTHSLELVRGVVLVGTPGHTRDHLSVVLEGEPRLFFAGDAAYSEAALFKGIPDGLATDADAARATMARIRVFLAERETVFLPTHDPEAPARLARYGDEHRRFRPRIVQDAQGDAVEPQQVAPRRSSAWPRRRRVARSRRAGRRRSRRATPRRRRAGRRPAGRRTRARRTSERRPAVRRPRTAGRRTS